MTNTKKLLLSIAAIMFALPAYAAGPIATMNVDEILQKSTAAVSIREQMETKEKAFHEVMSKKEAQFDAEQKELVKQRGVLSPEAFEKKVKAFKAKEGTVQKEVQAKRAELDEAFSTALAQIQKGVSDIAAEMAKEKGYSAVLPARMLVWADPSLDITKDVLAKLNTTLPKVTVTFKEKEVKE